MQCPKCNRTVAEVAGAARVQCFGCGTIIDVAAMRGRGTSGSSNNSGTGGGRYLLVVIPVAIVLLLVIGVGGLTAWFLMSGKPPAIDQPAPVPPSTPAQVEPEELVPAYTATDEERALAAKVPAAQRAQIMEMWDAMRATTGKKLLAPKGSVVRNSVENLMSAIEQREIQNMSALLQIDEPAVKAVIQVELADRAEKAAADYTAGATIVE